MTQISPSASVSGVTQDNLSDIQFRAVCLLLELSRLRQIEGWAGVGDALVSDVLHTVKILVGSSASEELEQVVKDPLDVRRKASWHLLQEGHEPTERAAEVIADVRVLSAYGLVDVAKRLLSILSLSEDGRAYMLERGRALRARVVGLLREGAARVAAEPPKPSSETPAEAEAPATEASATPAEAPAEAPVEAPSEAPVGAPVSAEASSTAVAPTAVAPTAVAELVATTEPAPPEPSADGAVTVPNAPKAKRRARKKVAKASKSET